MLDRLRVIRQLVEVEKCVDFEFSCSTQRYEQDTHISGSTVCPVLLGLMGIWQKRLCNWARWWNTQIKVNPTQVSEKRNHPVYGTLAAFEVLSKFKRNIAAVKSHDATE